MGLFDEESSAILSDCGTYRYLLRRFWSDDPDLCWLMLNPSTADAEVDDPTIRRCCAFALSWGYGGIRVLNLYALRATDPRQLWKHPDPVGPENDQYLIDEVLGHFVVAAWGANARPDRVRRVMDLIHSNALAIDCLGVTKGGHPRHPLYVPGDTKLVPFRG